MDGSTLLGPINNLVPEFCLEDFTGRESLIDQTGTLLKYPPCANGIVSDFTVSHILVRGEPHCRTMSLELGIQF